MNTFYEFYKNNNGNLSEILFNLFWHGQFQEAVDFYAPVVNAFGAIEKLGIKDAIVYLHCLIMSNKYPQKSLNFPEPPSLEEALSLISYEILQEKKSFVSRTKEKQFLSQPHCLSKALLACKIGIENNCKTVIETGTFLGVSSYLFSGIFREVHTIEADPMLHRTSTYWLNQLRNNIRAYNGNSGEILSKLLAQINEPCLFFLDAHYSEGITSNEYGFCPLIEELTNIFLTSQNHAIVIDDIRCMETQGYPSFKEIFDTIPAGKKVHIEHDQMIIN